MEFIDSTQLRPEVFCFFKQPGVKGFKEVPGFQPVSLRLQVWCNDHSATAAQQMQEHGIQKTSTQNIIFLHVDKK